MIFYKNMHIDPEAGKVYRQSPDGELVELGYEKRGSQLIGGKRVRTKPYWVLNIGGKCINRSRLIYEACNGALDKPFIDHINGDSLDDSLSNLRTATAQENARNRKHIKGNGLPIGVCFHRRLGKYQASIMIDGRPKYLGVFDSISDAGFAYQSARKEAFGEYA